MTHPDTALTRDSLQVARQALKDLPKDQERMIREAHERMVFERGQNMRRMRTAAVISNRLPFLQEEGKAEGGFNQVAGDKNPPENGSQPNGHQSPAARYGYTGRLVV